MDYIDTSALLKAYVPEPGSEAFVAWAAAVPHRCISALSGVELHCAVDRRQRAGQLTPRQRTSTLTAFDSEVGSEVYRVLGWPGTAFDGSRSVMERCRPLGLRALDALHLAVALHHRCTGFATADRAQAQAARRLGFEVHTFFPTP